MKRDIVKRTLEAGNPAVFTVFDFFYGLAGAAGALVTIPKGYIASSSDAAARARFVGRLGAANVPPPSGKPRVLFHGVSVGEVKLIKTLLHEAEKQKLQIEPVVSSTTSAG